MAELVEGTGRDERSAEFVRACHTATAGNPFLLRELLRALEDEDVRGDDGPDRIARLAPRTISRAVLGRLGRLGPDATDLAFAVAILGVSAEPRHAAELAALDADAAGSAADALVAAGILRRGRPLEFVHPIVRTAVSAEIPSARRDAAHRRAARLLDEDGAAPEVSRSTCSPPPRPAIGGWSTGCAPGPGRCSSGARPRRRAVT